jgi:hypothetical protein
MFPMCGARFAIFSPLLFVRTKKGILGFGDALSDRDNNSIPARKQRDDSSFYKNYLRSIILPDNRCAPEVRT